MGANPPLEHAELGVPPIVVRTTAGKDAPTGSAVRSMGESTPVWPPWLTMESTNVEPPGGVALHLITAEPDVKRARGPVRPTTMGMVNCVDPIMAMPSVVMESAVRQG